MYQVSDDQQRSIDNFQTSPLFRNRQQKKGNKKRNEWELQIYISKRRSKLITLEIYIIKYLARER
jgi:hypothetical protein